MHDIIFLLMGITFISITITGLILKSIIKDIDRIQSRINTTQIIDTRNNNG